MGRVAATRADRVYVTTDNPRSEEPAAIVADIRSGIPMSCDCRMIIDRRAAIRAAVRDAEAGDIILVAGKGHEDYQDIAGERFHFDDAEELRHAIADLGETD